MKLITRYLRPEDVTGLLILEQAKWEPHQMADAATLLRRIEAFPQLSIGSFCAASGKAMASMFMRPISPHALTAPTCWDLSADVDRYGTEPDSSRALFGISLSSINIHAVGEMFRFFHPRALKAGWRDVYLGSPIPGFKKARLRNPELEVWEYVYARCRFRTKEPRDPQLRYYYRKGFREIISIQKDYFPHEDSLNYGVILRYPIPLSAPRKIWSRTPMFILETFSLMSLR